MKVFIRLAGEGTVDAETIKRTLVTAVELCFHEITQNLKEAELLVTDSPVTGAYLLRENPMAILAIYLVFRVQDAAAVTLAREFPGRVEICTLFNDFFNGRKPLVVYLEELGSNKWLHKLEGDC